MTRALQDDCFECAGVLNRDSSVASRQPLWIDRLLTRILAPVDMASLIAFRVGFGAIAVWWAVDYLVRGRMHVAYLVPKFHFTYLGFDWVQPWPGAGLYLHFILLALAGAAIAVGFLYRAATIAFAVGFTYVLLLDRTNYQNHYYLLLLVSWLMTLLRLNGMMSVDVLQGIAKRRATVPQWMLWLARFHIGLPYFFGGVAKLEADWFAGAPLRQTLHAHDWWPLIGPWLRCEPVVQAFIWGGVVFDLAIVPLLLWRRTRIPAYCLCVAFHLLNSQLFSIHIFPWFMLVATTVFFEPHWPRRVFRLASLPKCPVETATWSGLSRWTRIVAALLCGYCVFHCVWPLRHYAYPGPASWTEQGHFFAWRMMLRGKNVGIRYYATDSQTRQTQLIDPRPILSPIQVGMFPRDPEMILHLAHHIAAEYRRLYGREVEVRALVLTSLNGRKPQLQIDPNVDLAKIQRGSYSRPWIYPQSEPLPETPWTVPIAQWEKHVELPKMPFLDLPSVARPAEARPALAGR